MASKSKKKVKKSTSPEKPLETRGFQDIVRRFDERWWYAEHSPGPATLVHQYLHLIPSITRAIPEYDADTPESRAYPDLWRDEVAPRLLEHAARIINQIEGHAVIFVCRDNLDVIGVVRWGKQRRLNELTFAISPATDLGSHVCAHDVEILLKKLQPFGEICERLDSGAEFHPDGEFAKPLVRIAAVMMQFAYHMTPLARGGGFNPKLRDAATKTRRYYLRMLRNRMESLHERNEVRERDEKNRASGL